MGGTQGVRPPCGSVSDHPPCVWRPCARPAGEYGEGGEAAAPGPEGEGEELPPTLSAQEEVEAAEKLGAALGIDATKTVEEVQADIELAALR